MFLTEHLRARAKLVLHVNMLLAMVHFLQDCLVQNRIPMLALNSYRFVLSSNSNLTIALWVYFVCIC